MMLKFGNYDKNKSGSIIYKVIVDFLDFYIKKFRFNQE